MKLIVDIPEKIEEYIKDYIPIGAGDNVFCYPDEIVRMIQNGTPIPDNATNGDVMQMMFPKGVTAKFATFMRFVVGEDAYINCAYDWWNALYKAGDTE